MNIGEIEQLETEVETYYDTIKPNLRSIKNLILATPELTPEEKNILNKASLYQPLDEITADFSALQQWKKQQKGYHSVYQNVDMIMQINNEFLNFIRVYRDKIDDIILSQASINEKSDYTMRAYQKYSTVIREIIDLNHKLDRTIIDIQLSVDKKNNEYLQKKHQENMTIIKNIKDNAETQKSADKTLQIRFNEEYIKIINNARQQTDNLVTELNTDDGIE